MLFLEFSFCI